MASLYLFLTACLSLICLVNISGAKPELDQLLEQNTNDPFVKFLVVGDWGRRGLYNQSQVATQMGVIGEKEELDFIISTGDNFYEDGLTGVDDPAFNESFSNIYTTPSLQKPWYSVLGNHDYRGDVLAQLNPALKQIDGRWNCARYFTVNADRASADIIFVDTTPFVDKYFTDPMEHVYDWRGVLPRENYLTTVLKFLDERLKESTAKWKFVVGHHTIYSAGHHSNTTELITQVLPVLEANNVDFYFNGHDHCLEHISDPDNKIEFFTSGGGSKAWRGDIKPWNPEDLKLYYDGQGFMSVKITKTSADIEFYDVSGNVLHKWSKSKELNSFTQRTFTYA